MYAPRTARSTQLPAGVSSKDWTPSLWRSAGPGDQVLVIESGGAKAAGIAERGVCGRQVTSKDALQPDTTLQSCERDVSVVTRHFRRIGYPVRAINLGRGQQSAVRAPMSIRDFLTSCRGSAIVYFSGHGRKEDGAWALGPDGTVFVTWREMWRWITDARAAARARSVTVIIDSCFSGHWTQLAELSSVEVVAASAADQFSWGNEMGHFTRWCFCGGQQPRGCHTTTRWLCVDGRRGSPHRESKAGLCGRTHQTLRYEIRPRCPRIVREEKYTDEPQTPLKAGPWPAISPVRPRAPPTLRRHVDPLSRTAYSSSLHIGLH